ncbi:MAG: hypothetical protein PGN27_09395 [Mycolicibacterium neoaurum]|uniref:hypothetical protein n=1 Tax=Mycolicibacterium neoaurum TaxID=1795 RepID=UPI002FF8CD19
MAEAIDRVKKAGIVGIGAFAASCALLTFGAGTAMADDDTGPAPTEVGSQGVVSSPQSAATAAAKRCETSAGTLSTASVYVPDGNTPKQTVDEKGPTEVGSNGWIAINVNPSSPWNASFFNGANTGPQCTLVRAPGATGRGLQ